MPRAGRCMAAASSATARSSTSGNSASGARSIMTEPQAQVGSLAEPSMLDAMLSALGPVEEGIWRISGHRGYFMPEAEYSERHRITVQPNPVMGATIARHLRESGA